MYSLHYRGTTLKHISIIQIDTRLFSNNKIKVNDFLAKVLRIMFRIKIKRYIHLSEGILRVPCIRNNYSVNV